MSDEKRETVENIVEEMRRGTKLPGFWRSCDLNKILQFHADRIEAAWKRERAAILADAAKLGRGKVEVVYSAEKPRGNAAAMRDALVSLQGLFEDEPDGTPWVDAAKSTIEAALAEPARNCDKYATADEALKAQQAAFEESNFENGECKLGCPGCDDFPIKCEVRWLFAPAAERKGEGND